MAPSSPYRGTWTQEEPLEPDNDATIFDVTPQIEVGDTITVKHGRLEVTALAEDGNTIWNFAPWDDSNPVTFNTDAPTTGFNIMNKSTEDYFEFKDYEYFVNGNKVIFD